MNLVVGATGLLGREICSLLTHSGRPVRALVRASSDPVKVARLHDSGADVVHGDLKDRASIEVACRGVSAVISTASSTLSRQPGDSIDTVDRQGQLDLIDAAEAAGVQHFVLISFPGTSVDFPLQSAKREVEARLQEGRMTWTILQPTCFAEVWLSPALGFDVGHATAQIYGAGHHKTTWISLHDVAQFAVAALEAPHAANAVIRLGGPEALSPLDVVHLAERITGRAFTVQHVSEDALHAQHAAATDPMQQSFAGLMLYYAAGDVVDMADTLRLFGVPPMRSVYEHLQSSLLQSGQEA
jgi:uncharacterized protein YbjT (DUF2867 family)